MILRQLIEGLRQVIALLIVSRYLCHVLRQIINQIKYQIAQHSAHIIQKVFEEINHHIHLLLLTLI